MALEFNFKQMCQNAGTEYGRRQFHRSFETKILLILSLILLIHQPTNIAIADDPAYDDGFQKGIAAGLAMDDSSSSKIIDCSPMVNPIKIAECEAG
jgi:hypothetical protein